MKKGPRTISGCATSQHRPGYRSPIWLLVALFYGAIETEAAKLSPRSVADMSLERLLAVPVSVASLAAESFVDAPSSVTTFTRQEIFNLGVRNVEQLLNFVPGWQSVRTASRNTYAVGARGRNSAQLSNDILFLLNGLRVNDDVTGAALLFNRYLATGNVERVEVIRGPGSALYGSNAFLGVVNIVTSVDLNEAFIAGASHDGLEGYLALSGGDERYHASLFLSGLKDSGERYDDPTNPGGPRIDDPRQAVTAYGTFSTDGLRLDVRYAEFSADEFYLYRVTPGNALNEYRADDTYLALRYDLLRDEERKLQVRTSFRRINNEGLAEPFDAAFMGLLNAQGLTSGTEAFLGGPAGRFTTWNLGLDGVTPLGARHRLFAGLDYRQTKFDKLTNRNNYETLDLLDWLFCANPAAGCDQPAEIRYYGDVVETEAFGPEGESREVFGLYLQDKIAIHSALHATLGVRFDHYSDFGGTWNPRAAVVYRQSAATTFKLMYGEAFRAPTVSESSVKTAPPSVGNPDLHPEKIKTLELAWLQDFGGAHLTLTGYYSRLEDQILRVPVGVPGDPRFTFANRGALDLSGLEVEFLAEITDGLTLRGAYAHAFELASNPQTFPRNTASLIVNHAYGRLNTNLSLLYRDWLETGTTPAQPLDEAWLLNLNLRYAFPGMTLVGTVYNLTDDDSGGFTQADIPGGTPARGRSYRLGLELAF